MGSLQRGQQQIHGGMAQGIGYGLFEELQIDPKTGRVLNPTLLDYKIPTMMDLPDLAVCLGAALIVYVAVELEKAWRRRNAAALAMDEPVR